MEHKIGIMMCYFERPNMVRFALESIKRQGYTNWELCFVDDTATRSGEESVRDMFGDDPRVFTTALRTLQRERVSKVVVECVSFGTHSSYLEKQM